jgi:S1-C subfamily serine protease
MSDYTPASPDDRAHPQSRRRGIVLSALLALVLSLNLVLPGGLQAVASVLPGNSSPNATTLQSATPDEATTNNGTKSRADIAEAANPAVVTIYTEQDMPDFFQGQRQLPGNADQGQDDSGQITGAGSGFIIDEDGHVVTNNHVVANGDSFLVELIDGTTVNATLVGRDPVQDVAVLQLELEDGQSVPGTLAWGDSDTVRPGDDVIAIGTPLGEFTNSVSAGVVGGVNRTLSDMNGSLDNLIQHDAPISSGNSGGPLLNMNGEVVGINTAAATGSQLNAVTTDGLGFAVASNSAKAIVDQLLADGSVSRPYLGIEGQPLVEGHGVVSVEDGSPADEAGLEPGDVITAIDGSAIDADNTLQSLLYTHQPGDEVTLTVQRDNDEITLQVTLGERPGDL